MNRQRQHLPPRLSVVLLLLSCCLGMRAQILEYWFDDNFYKKATIPINVGSESMQVLELDFTDMVKFPLGFHRLNYRVVANGAYSPVYSDCVMRIPDGEHSEIIYWLDDDYNKEPDRKSVV